MKRQSKHVQREVRIARALWGKFTSIALGGLKDLLRANHFSVAAGDLLYLEGRWYVTHTGLLHLALRKRCSGIDVRPVDAFSEPESSRWTFKATVCKSAECKGFMGFGDADPSNVSPLVHGAEMRVAETRAVNRALRKAYGIGICSVEEIGSFTERVPSPRESKKIPPQPRPGEHRCCSEGTVGKSQRAPENSSNCEAQTNAQPSRRRPRLPRQVSRAVLAGTLPASSRLGFARTPSHGARFAI
jgi:hypothetical protein